MNGKKLRRKIISILVKIIYSKRNSLGEAIEEILEILPRENGISVSEKMLLTNILKLRKKTVVDCMVPRADIIAIDVESGLQRLLECMAEHAHSRIPVYRETLDETIGLVHMKDVLAHMAHGKEPEIKEILRPVLFVAPSMPASRLLLQMRQSRKHMAMVVDEFGGIDGLVTIEDLVEEIVGEIEDEHDEPSAPEIISRPDGTLLVDGRLSMDSLEKLTGELLSEEERENIDTVGGYVFHLAGHIPQIGETVRNNKNLIFEVLETNQGRVKRVRVKGIISKG